MVYTAAAKLPVLTWDAKLYCHYFRNGNVLLSLLKLSLSYMLVYT